MKRRVTCKDIISKRDTKDVYYDPFNNYSLHDCLFLAMKRTLPEVDCIHFKRDKLCKYFVHKEAVDSFSETDDENSSNTENCLILCSVIKRSKTVALCNITVDITL